MHPPCEHGFEEVYVHRLFVRFRPAELLSGNFLLPGQLEPVFDLRQQSPFRRVSAFHITTIQLGEAWLTSLSRKAYLRPDAETRPSLFVAHKQETLKESVR